jgi:hypothetical protein
MSMISPERRAQMMERSLHFRRHSAQASSASMQGGAEKRPLSLPEGLGRKQALQALGSGAPYRSEDQVGLLEPQGADLHEESEFEFCETEAAEDEGERDLGVGYWEHARPAQPLVIPSVKDTFRRETVHALPGNPLGEESPRALKDRSPVSWPLSNPPTEVPLPVPDRVPLSLSETDRGPKLGSGPQEGEIVEVRGDVDHSDETDREWAMPESTIAAYDDGGDGGEEWAADVGSNFKNSERAELEETRENLKRLTAEVQQLKAHVQQLVADQQSQPRGVLLPDQPKAAEGPKFFDEDQRSIQRSKSLFSRTVSGGNGDAGSEHNEAKINAAKLAMRRKQSTAQMITTNSAGQEPRSRIAVRIVWARDTIEPLPDCYVKISVGQNKIKTGVAIGGQEMAIFDFAGSLEVSEGASELVCELFKVGKIIGKKHFGKNHLIGQVSVSIAKVPAVNISDSASDDPLAKSFANLMRGSAHQHVEPADYPLFGAHGQPTSEEIRMQLLLVSTSRTPKPLSVFAGTWNVGNAPPDEELGSWLRESQILQADLIAIGAQECEYKTRPKSKGKDKGAKEGKVSFFRPSSKTKREDTAGSAETRVEGGDEQELALDDSENNTEKLKCHEEVSCPA